MISWVGWTLPPFVGRLLADAPPSSRSPRALRVGESSGVDWVAPIALTVELGQCDPDPLAAPRQPALALEGQPIGRVGTNRGADQVVGDLG